MVDSCTVGALLFILLFASSQDSLHAFLRRGFLPTTRKIFRYAAVPEAGAQNQKKNNWLDRDNEIIIDGNAYSTWESSDEYFAEGDERVNESSNSGGSSSKRITRNSNSEASLFDTLYNSARNDAEEQSIATLSLREISEAYLFSLSFLGDYASEMGVATPLDVNTAIGNIMTGDMIFSLLEALTSLDPLESNTGYDSLTVSELAEEIGFPLKIIIQICLEEKVGLPFGADTMLHVDVVKQVRRVAEYDEYNEFKEVEVEQVWSSDSMDFIDVVVEGDDDADDDADDDEDDDEDDDAEYDENDYEDVGEYDGSDNYYIDV